MSLPSSGAIRMSQIKTALGSSSNSLRNYSATAGKSAPDAMSEFYSYSPPPSYFYYTAEYCGTALSAGVVRFNTDQSVNGVFETTQYVCVRLTGVTFGPTYNIDLGDGSTYVGNNCSFCPQPPPPPPPPVTYDYYDYEPCTGPGAYGGAQYTLQVISGYTPSCIFYNGQTYTQVGLGAYSGPANYTLFSGTEVACGSCE